jgi:hypothetical protein
MLDSVDVEFDHVNSSVIDILSHKQILDILGELCQRTQDSQEVAITKRTLADVVWCDST